MLKTFVQCAAAVALSLLLTACGNFQKREQVAEIDVTDEIEKGNESAYHPSPEFGQIELEVNPAVQKWLNYFTGRGRRHMNRYLTRSSRYLPMMKRILRRRGMPEELVYVPLIESGFNSSAYSHASAVGYWQFIRPTGKAYGLAINTYVDERRDPVLSTEAAADYYTALYNLFGDWYLALAAYNTGENRVKKAVMRYRTRNFWKLAKGRRLHRETRNYVPKFIAAALIHKNPEKYGFTDVDYQDALNYDVLEIEKPISLLKLSKNMGVDFKELKKLNPLYRSDFVPIYKGSMIEVRVPRGRAIAAVAALQKSYSDKPLVKLEKGYFWYRIRRGDTLSGIAHKYRTRVSTLRRLNNLSRRSVIRAGKKLKVPERYGRSSRVAKKSSRKSPRVVSPTNRYHIVKRGDTLSEIAESYKTRVSTLRRLNRMGRRSMLRIGQKVYLPGGKDAPGKKSIAKSSKKQKRSVASDRVHVVRRGHNLSTIAQRYGLSVGKLRRMNNLGRRSKIYPGQVLVVKPESGVHIVRRGENLSVIAKKYGTTVGKITRANAMGRRSKLLVGKRLVIPQ